MPMLGFLFAVIVGSVQSIAGLVGGWNFNRQVAFSSLSVEV